MNSIALQLEVADGMGVFVLLTMGVEVVVAVNGIGICVFVLVMAGVALSRASTVCAAAVRLASSP